MDLQIGRYQPMAVIAKQPAPPQAPASLFDAELALAHYSAQAPALQAQLKRRMKIRFVANSVEPVWWLREDYFGTRMPARNRSVRASSQRDERYRRGVVKQEYGVCQKQLPWHRLTLVLGSTRDRQSGKEPDNSDHSTEP